MKTIEFNDANGNKLKVQHSSAIQPHYRIYFKFVDKDGKIPDDDDWNHCVHMNECQAEILINALQDLFNDNDR